MPNSGKLSGPVADTPPPSVSATKCFLCGACSFGKDKFSLEQGGVWFLFPVVNDGPKKYKKANGPSTLGLTLAVSLRPDKKFPPCCCPQSHTLRLLNTLNDEIRGLKVCLPWRFLANPENHLERLEILESPRKQTFKPLTSLFSVFCSLRALKSTGHGDRPFGILLMNVPVCQVCTFYCSDSLVCLPISRVLFSGAFSLFFLPGPMDKRCEPMLQQKHARNTKNPPTTCIEQMEMPDTCVLTNECAPGLPGGKQKTDTCVSPHGRNTWS